MAELPDEVRDTYDSAALFWYRRGEPMTLRQFSDAFSDPSYKIVARTDVGGCTVTTVCLPLEHHGGGRRPVRCRRGRAVGA
jgi:hypothetical protein